MKEALYIQAKPASTRFNRDRGYELPNCWIAIFQQMLKRRDFQPCLAIINYTIRQEMFLRIKMNFHNILLGEISNNPG